MIATLVSTDAELDETVITAEEPADFPLSDAFTKIPTVPAEVPALKVSEAPLPVSDPSAVLDSDHTYSMPDGQLALQVGVAVMDTIPFVATVGAFGLSATAVRVTAVVVTVITVDALAVVPPSVAFTKIPPVVAVLPAVKVTEAPLPESEPSALLERDQV